MSRLFKRAAQITIARPIPGNFFGAQANAIVVTQMHVRFEVEKTLRHDPNTCVITIDNLAEHTRAELQQKPLVIRLDAGYDNQPQRLFTGDLRWGQSRREGVSWETRLELGDGERAIRFARVSRSYHKGVDTLTAVREVSRTMGLSTAISPAATRALRGQFAGGLTVQGASREELTRLLRPHGMSWSVQDGKLQILLPTEHRAEQAIVVSQDTGMIGSPEYGPPSEKGKPPVLSFRMLLYPGLTPGGLVRVQSRAIRGIFKVTRVRHQGDTHGAEWQSEVEATQQ